MSHHGPDPSEALPIGEETLSPEELGRVATAMFGYQEALAELNSRAILTTEEHEAVQKLKTQAREIWGDPAENIFQILKDGLLHPPE
jgi:hypothetical protein